MKQMLTNSALSAFAGELSMILHSGISFLEGISIIRDDTPEGPERVVLDKIYETLEYTGDPGESLQSAEVFPEYFVKMIEIGERSGTLEEVTASLSDYYSRQDRLMNSIREVLLYPMIMLGMLFAVLMVLMTQVMPVFKSVFAQLGIETNGISGTVFALSGILQKVVIVLLILLVLSVAFCFISFRSEKGIHRLQHFILYFPIGKHVTELLACSRFSNVLELSLHSGLDMGESFDLASQLVHQELFDKKTSKAKELIQEGEDLGEALKNSGIITGLNARMVNIGFRTGSAEEIFHQISIQCQEDADHRIQSAVSALEPTLTAVLSILTGTILISVMLPLLSVMTGIG